MKNKETLKNMIIPLCLQMIAFANGMILPRYFLQAYGSSVNGMIVSITQILAYLKLVESGVGAASIAALYKPLSENNKEEISGILSATKYYYRKAAMLLLVFSFILAFLYPMLLGNQIDSTLVTAMILVLSSFMIVDLLFQGKYRVLLTADQKLYVYSLVQGVGTLIIMVVTILLISFEVNVLIVKSVAVFVCILKSIFLRMYIKRKYSHIDEKAKPINRSLKQKNAALLHQVVGVIVHNTDVLLLTICLGTSSLFEVSIYGVYALVAYGINILFYAIFDGVVASFGELLSKKEYVKVKQRYSKFEMILIAAVTAICSCTCILYIPFIKIYTAQVVDVDYIRPITAVLFTITTYLQNIRIPALMMVCAKGHFKETQRSAIIEGVINFVVSIILVWPMGINGVLIGTICSGLYRAIDLYWYNLNHIVMLKKRETVKRISANLLVGIGTTLLGIQLVPQNMGSFFEWLFYAVWVAMINAIVLLIINFVLIFQSKLLVALVKN